MVLLALSCLTACSSVPLEVREHGETVVIDVRTLGEYVTTVRKMQVREGDEIVWEIASKDGVVQWGSRTVSVGSNPAEFGQVYSGSTGTYKTIVPAEDDTYVLLPDVVYTVAVWGKRGGAREASFTLEPKVKAPRTYRLDDLTMILKDSSWDHETKETVWRETSIQGGTNQGVFRARERGIVSEASFGITEEQVRDLVTDLYESGFFAIDSKLRHTETAEIDPDGIVRSVVTMGYGPPESEIIVKIGGYTHAVHWNAFGSPPRKLVEFADKLYEHGQAELRGVD